MHVGAGDDLGCGVLTISRTVAEVFEKRHADVVRSVRMLVENEPSLGQRNFASALYADESRQAAAVVRHLSRRLRAAGHGVHRPKALRWKLLYIDAFNQTEAALRAALPAPTAGELSAAEYHRIGEIVKVKAVTCKAIDDRLDPLRTKSVGSPIASSRSRADLSPIRASTLSNTGR